MHINLYRDKGLGLSGAIRDLHMICSLYLIILYARKRLSNFHIGLSTNVILLIMDSIIMQCSNATNAVERSDYTDFSSGCNLINTKWWIVNKGSLWWVWVRLDFFICEFVWQKMLSKNIVAWQHRNTIESNLLRKYISKSSIPIACLQNCYRKHEKHQLFNYALLQKVHDIPLWLTNTVNVNIKQSAH